MVILVRTLQIIVVLAYALPALAVGLLITGFIVVGLEYSRATERLAELELETERKGR